ncbi:unnamed protein product, partial [Amoebophrya sp. A120]
VTKRRDDLYVNTRQLAVVRPFCWVRFSQAPSPRPRALPRCSSPAMDVGGLDVFAKSKGRTLVQRRRAATWTIEGARFRR